MQSVKRKSTPSLGSRINKRSIKSAQVKFVPDTHVAPSFDIASEKDFPSLSSSVSAVDQNSFIGLKAHDEKRARFTPKTEIDTLSIQFHARADGTTVEEDNKTNTTRTIVKYEEVLEISFTPFLNWHYNNNGLINILDAGCGNAVFSKELLASEHGAKIKKVYGVSLDKFAGAVSLRETCRKFVFMHMPINVAASRLEGLGVKINIIFDVWGPFSYTLQKMDVLRDYFSLLQRGGRAFLYLGACLTHSGEVSAMPKISFKGQDNTETEPEDILVGLSRHFPKIFKLNDKCNRVLIMRKNEDTPFPFSYEFTHVCSPILGFSFQAKGVSRKEMIEGNAAMPAEIIIRPKLQGL